MEKSVFKALSTESTKWRPKIHPQKVLAGDSSPEPDDSSDTSDSNCGSINEEDVCIKNVETVAQECTIIKRSIYIQKNLRVERACRILENAIKWTSFKRSIFILIKRKIILQHIYFHIQARKISRLFKAFINQRRAVTEEILKMYREHCAAYIQKIFRGYMIRKNSRLQKYKLYKAKLKALLLGWKVRRVMKHPDAVLLKRKIKSSPFDESGSDFMRLFCILYEGRWAKKEIQLPKHRKILYKNNTLTLRLYTSENSAIFRKKKILTKMMKFKSQ